jgi:hypothetical protein
MLASRQSDDGRILPWLGGISAGFFANPSRKREIACSTVFPVARSSHSIDGATAKTFPPM